MGYSILVIGLIEIRARLYVTCWEWKLEVNYIICTYVRSDYSGTENRNFQFSVPAQYAFLQKRFKTTFLRVSVLDDSEYFRFFT